MKKVLLLFALMSSIGFSQKVLLGPEFGTNLIQLETLENGKNFHPGWHGGVAFEYKFNDWLSINTGVMYTQKRQAYSSADTSSFEFFGLLDSSFSIEGLDLNTYMTTSGRTSQHFFEIPVMASFNYKGLTASIGGYAGFQFSARRRETTTTRTPFMQTLDVGSLLGGLLGGTDTTGGGGIGGGLGGFNTNDLLASFLPKAYEETTTEVTGTDGLRSFDYGLKFNVGYQPNAFGAYLSYQIGAKSYSNVVGIGDKQRHQYLQLSVRYLFGLDKPNFSNSHM
jgi:hypothetical protein